MFSFVKKHAFSLGAGAVLLVGISSAAVVQIPTISDTFAVDGQIIKSADINALAQAINILDARTDGDMPVDDVDLVNKGYLTTAVSAAGDWQKGEVCPTGQIMIGYNADGTIACDTAENLGIGGGSGSASTAPDVSGVTGFGKIASLEIDGLPYAVVENIPPNGCAALGEGWLSPSRLSPNAYFSLTVAIHDGTIYHSYVDICAYRGEVDPSRKYIYKADHPLISPYYFPSGNATDFCNSGSRLVCQYIAP